VVLSVIDPPRLGAFERKTVERPLMTLFDRTGLPAKMFDAWFEKGDRSYHVVMLLPESAKLEGEVASNHREHPPKFSGEKPETGCACFPTDDIVLLRRGELYWR
jgi:hypothetical protein